MKNPDGTISAERPTHRKTPKGQIKGDEQERREGAEWRTAAEYDSTGAD